jgi:REP element-mobilizing transposase RayT
MPHGLVRYEHTGSFHFLTFSCYHRAQYLRTQAARNLFEDALERVRIRYRFVVAGYVVMPEHVHLLIGEPQKSNVSGVVHALKLSVVMRRPERLLAGTLLRFSCAQRGEARGKASLHPSQSGCAWPGHQTRRLGVVKLQALCNGSHWNSRDRVGVDGEAARNQLPEFLR